MIGVQQVNRSLALAVTDLSSYVIRAGGCNLLFQPLSIEVMSAGLQISQRPRLACPRKRSGLLRFS
jgi:hypothetical protein